MHVRWGNMYSCWFPILAGVRQGGILSLIFFALYMDPLIIQLRNLALGCNLHDEFFGCLLYAGDILLMSHTVHSVQMIIYVMSLPTTVSVCV